MLKSKNVRLIICVYLLTIFGIVMIYSASNYSANLQFGDAFYYVKKQVIAFVFAIICQIIASKLSMKSIENSSLIIYIISIVLLIAVFIPGIGVENYGATRWLNLGVTTFQPSELAKFALVMIVAKCLSKKSSNNWISILKIGFLALITIGLILLEPNMSIAMCIGIVLLIMLFIGGIKVKHFLIILLPICVGVLVLIAIEPYRLSRLMAYVDPWASPLAEGYQLIQSYYSLAGGGLFGVGLFNSIQKCLFLPFSESDFIFSIIGEELGLIGCIFIIIIYLIIAIDGINIAILAKDRYSTYLASGITSIISIQTLLNIAVVTGSIPPTGLPLPFISAGGSSLVVFYIFIGVLENISKNSQKNCFMNKMY